MTSSSHNGLFSDIIYYIHTACYTVQEVSTISSYLSTSDLLGVAR